MTLKNRLKVLIACEFSGVVRDAFIRNEVEMKVGKLDELDYSILDEGVRDIVRVLREKGLYQTTDSEAQFFLHEMLNRA